MKYLLLGQGLLQEGMAAHIVSSITAGLAVATTTNPLDLVKSRYMNQEFDKVSGLHVCAGGDIYKGELVRTIPKREAESERLDSFGPSHSSDVFKKSPRMSSQPPRDGRVRRGIQVLVCLHYTDVFALLLALLCKNCTTQLLQGCWASSCGWPVLWLGDCLLQLPLLVVWLAPLFDQVMLAAGTLHWSSVQVAGRQAGSAAQCCGRLPDGSCHSNSASSADVSNWCAAALAGDGQGAALQRCC